MPNPDDLSGVPPITPEERAELLQACRFDWTVESVAVRYEAALRRAEAAMRKVCEYGIQHSPNCATWHRGRGGLQYTIKPCSCGAVDAYRQLCEELPDA